MLALRHLLALLILTACSQGQDPDGDLADAGGAAGADAAVADAPVATADAASADAATVTPDASTNGDPDAAPYVDAGSSSPDGGGSGGVITGGPCISGAAGATAYRVRWADGGSTTYPVYEVNGLPDTSRDHTGAYGYQIGFTPQFVDPYLGDGGLLLNSSSFVDIELSTVGVAQIQTATLSIYGRSYNTTTSGSFNWQTFSGTGAAPSNLVSNSAPYEWYSADMTTELDPGDDSVLIRIEAGPSSNSLVVNEIELCLEAS